MYFKFSPHDTSKGSSSLDYISYLEKENDIAKNENEIAGDNELFREVFFFNSEKEEDGNFVEFDKKDVVNGIDNNKAKLNKEMANFYKLDISPSKKELECIERISEEELKKRGIEKGNDEYTNALYITHKNELIEQQLKEYSKDVMKEYASNFNREIYTNEEKIPKGEERKILNNSTDKIYNEAFLKKSFNELYKEKPPKSNIKNYTNFYHIKEVDNTFKAEIELEKKKYDIEIPNKLILNERDLNGKIIIKNNELKLPENFYNDKVLDIQKRNTIVEINHKFDAEKTSKKNNNEYFIFKAEHKNLNEKFDLVFDKKDVEIKNGKYLVNEKILELKYNTALKKQIEVEYPYLKKDIFEKLASKKGYDMSKRPLEEKDIMWYGKVEKDRTWKPNDAIVFKNEELLKKINLAKSGTEKGKLEEGLIKNSNGENIKAGMKKDGLNYHVHLVISRHDKTMINPENKISLSPLANAKDSNGVGFDRKEFMKKNIGVFDEKFGYERKEEEKYLEKTNGTEKGIIESKVENQIKGKAEREVKKIVGLDQVQNELKFINLSLSRKPSFSIQPIKQQIGLDKLPNIKLSTIITNPKKAIVDLTIGTIKKVIGLDRGY